MTLYSWDTVLYDAIKAYFPRCFKSKWKEKRIYNMGVLYRLPLEQLKVYVENTDIYFAGVQLVLNLGFTSIYHSPVEYGILPHPSEDLTHIKRYTCTPNGGQIDYYYPFKKRSVIFK